MLAVMCYPSHVRVQLQNGSIKGVGELEVGDWVKIGPGAYSPVASFSIRRPNHKTEMVTLHMENGSQVTMTATHYLYVNSHLKHASEAVVGDHVLTAAGTWTRIVKVQKETVRGVYHPHTAFGEVAVGGIVSSCRSCQDRAVRPVQSTLLCTLAL